MSDSSAGFDSTFLGDDNLRSWDIRTQDMPEEMRVLLAEYPRESWETHPGFHEKTIHWLGAHQMFRRLAATVREDTESYLDGNKEAREYTGRLSYYGGMLVNYLHGHHGWEDHSYFPELSAADSRFDAGLAILEKDHVVLNQVLDDFTRTAEAGKLHTVSLAIETLLQRHLGDEEELAVPIILHHRLRG